MKKKHVTVSSLRHNQHGQNLKLKRHLQESSTTQGGEKSGLLFSSTEENLSQVESLTCWICQEELSNQPCLIQHYDDHMKSI